MIRKWNYINSRESEKSTQIHGRSMVENTWIICRSSMFKLWNNKIGKFGKGNLSRSEPFYGNPNPCFDSVGKAGRENKLSHSILLRGWEFENLHLNLVEIFYLLKIKKFKISPKNNTIMFNRFSNALNYKFYWNFIIYERYKKLGWQLKSGIKYGGNFISYKKKKDNLNRIHNHSKSVTLLQIPCLYEIFCTKCSKKLPLIFLNIQNKTRLGQQVSKNILYLFFFLKKKFTKKKLYRKWIFTEIGIDRWVFSNLNL
nr:26S proteasome AAA-ATPase subunit [Cryptomonas curvata]